MLFVHVSACADRLIVGRAVCAAGKVSVFLLCAPLMRVDSASAAFSSQKTENTHATVLVGFAQLNSHCLAPPPRYSLFLSIKLATFFIYLFVVCPRGLAPSVCLCVQGAPLLRTLFLNSVLRLCLSPFFLQFALYSPGTSIMNIIVASRAKLNYQLRPRARTNFLFCKTQLFASCEKKNTKASKR